MKADIPSSQEFVSGRLKGDVATMQVKGRSYNPEDGSEIPNSQVAITITMKKENGDWCFDGQKPAAAGTAAPAAAGKGKSGK